MDDVAWPEEFEAILRSYLPDPPPLGSLEPDLCLPDAGIDSLRSINLMIDLEDGFEIVLPDSELTAETFSSPARLWAVVRGCLLTRH